MIFFQDTGGDSIFKQIKALNIWETSLCSNENIQREAKLFNVDSMHFKRIKLEKAFSMCLVKNNQSEGVKEFLLMNLNYRLSPKRVKGIFLE